jgi:hypothetical protein
MTYGAVRVWLQLEGLAAFCASLWLYSQSQSGWLVFALLFLVPDLSLLGHLAGPRAGAAVYNLVHSYTLPLGLLLVGLGADGVLAPLALIWTAHISLDRLVGFGLKYPTGFSDTHLGRIGWAQPPRHRSVPS